MNAAVLNLAPPPRRTAPARAPGPHYTLRNAHNMCVTISVDGAAMVSWLAPDRNGQIADVLLGHAGAAGYVENDGYFGAVIGPWANRIADGRFVLDGVPHQLACNDRGHHLHGADFGFHRARWSVSALGGRNDGRGELAELAECGDRGELSVPCQVEAGDHITLRLRTSASTAGGLGNIEVRVRYCLSDDGSLTITYSAQVDATMPLNLTAHPYFNLNGGLADIGAHCLQIDADAYLAIDASGIPIARKAVRDTAFDFRQPVSIASRLAANDPQIVQAGGFDHCFCLSPRTHGQDALRDVASVFDPVSGRRLQVRTTEAGLQFYSGNALGGVAGRGKQPYARHAGFCLEAQAFPNQINGPDAAAVIVRPGQIYRQTTVYTLGLAHPTVS